MRTFTVLIALVFVLTWVFTGVVAGQPAHAQTGSPACRPTSPDMLGPFYKPGAAVRSKVGEGYLLRGVVRSARDCSPIKGARVEFWLAGPDGRYDDEHRATVLPEESGSYRFESNFPPAYYSRPPHIHIRVSAEGYRRLVTQHYPEKGAKEGALDLVLTPER
jgi:protocatechuate 3,4-dioxygenase beta subunit